MTTSSRTIGAPLAVVVGLASLSFIFAQPSRAAGILVADRTSNKVFRYSETGMLLGSVLPTPGPNDTLQLNQPVGLAFSPDLDYLYVSSFQNARILRYDYNYSTGTASGGIIFADAADGLASPNAILLSEEGDTIYVTNFGETGVSRFTPNGSQAGPPLFFAPPFQQSEKTLSGLAWTPDGDLLVGSFQSAPQGTHGAVGRVNNSQTAIDLLVPQNTLLLGASGLLVHDDFVYVTGMFTGTVRRFHLDDGTIDASFAVNDLGFPQALMASPDGNGFLVGVLGFGVGQGHIAHYDFNGVPVDHGNPAGAGYFATPSAGGFNEATAFISTRPRGDFNDDGAVNAADLNDPLIGFKARFGEDLDGDDFLAWQRQLGLQPPSQVASASQTATAAVPEPATAALVLLVVLFVGGPGRVAASRLYPR